MYTKDLKNTKGIALIYLIMIILSILIISAVVIVGVTKNVNNGGLSQKISQKTSKIEEKKDKTINTSQTTETKKTSSNNSKSGKVTAEQIAKKPEKYYGQEVKNYTKGDRVYRIFYVDTEGYFGDKNTIYLKADWVANDVSFKDRGADLYTPKTTEVLEKMNQEWAKKGLSSSYTWSDNEHCVAWLCDPTTKDVSSNQEWAEYFDENKANYVIGSPSVEMYVKSYNQVPHEKGNNKIEVEFIDKGYKIGYRCYTESNTLDCEKYNSMYCSKDYNCDTWLASPSDWHHYHVCTVEGGFAQLNSGSYSYYRYGSSPVVSLKSDFTPEI